MRLPNKDRQAKISMIEQWKQSGLSQKEFYRQHNIPAHVFYYWHKCYRDQKKKMDKVPGSVANGFVRLTPTSAASSMELHLPDGIRIIFHEPVSADYLKTLIS